MDVRRVETMTCRRWTKQTNKQKNMHIVLHHNVFLPLNENSLHYKGRNFKEGTHRARFNNSVGAQ